MTLTEPETKKKRTTAAYYTSTEVVEMTGLSFRVLDYWLRNGTIRLADGGTPGTGTLRRYTRAEVAAIARLVNRYNRAKDELETIRTGKAWAKLIGDEDEHHVA